MNDVDVIKRILMGHKEEFSILMEKYHNELFHFVYNIVGNVETTEDLMQEIFFKIYQNLKKYDENKAAFRTWIYHVSQNYVYSYFKSKAYKETKSTSLEGFEHATTDNIEETMIEEERVKKILKLIHQLLSDKHQKIMLLHFFSGLTVKEISETLDVPEKTIYKAIKSSIEKIKKEVV